MSTLNMTKVAMGCAGLDALEVRLAARTVNGIVPVVTRFRPKRAGEMIGGSLFWIVKHRMIARQTILGFAETEEGRTLIQLDATLVPVAARPKRAHQGWRYLEAADAPPDLGGGGGIADLPPALAGQLAELALI